MRYDVIIVGGGLVGAGLAAALRNSNLQIALIDARMPSNNDPRLLALNFSSCQFLKNIGVWPQLIAHAAPIQQVHVSNQGRFGAVRLNCADVQLSSLGHVIPAYQIETALNAMLVTLPNVTLYRPAKLLTLTQQDGNATLTVEMENKNIILHTPLVIGADGTESTVRAQLNMKTEISDYEQCAIVTRTLLNRAHNQIAYERFMQNGAIAMLPLVGDECATIWTVDKGTAAKLLALSDNEFIQTLQKEFGYRLGRLQKTSQRYSFPLHKVIVEKNIDGCVFLLGNSAHTMHPIAAQGFNLALYEVAALAEELNKKTRHPRERGDFSPVNLLAISEQVQSQQSASIGVSHRLANLFSNPSALISCLLQLGMVGFDITPIAKNKFITKIMGRLGRVPHLLLSVNES